MATALDVLCQWTMRYYWYIMIFPAPMINFSCNTWEKYIYVCVYEKVTQIKYCIISWVSSVSFAWCRHVRKISQLSLIKRGNSLPRYVMSRCSSNSEEVQDDKEINIPVIRCICIHLHILTLYPLNATFWRWNGIFSFHLKKLVKTIKKTPLLIMYNVFGSVLLNTYHVYRKFTVHK